MKTKTDALAKGTIIMYELPTDTYLESKTKSIKQLIKEGYNGVYISFQRPYENLIEIFKKEKISTKSIKFIDIASSVTNLNISDRDDCVHVSTKFPIDELTRAIYLLLQKTTGKKKFVFIDSMTTITLYKPLSETMRFFEFLIRTVHNYDNSIKIIFNVPSDLSQKKFIKEVAAKVDTVIQVQ